MIAIEWAKQFRRTKTMVTLAIVAGFSLVLTVALAATGSGQVEFVGDITHRPVMEPEGPVTSAPGSCLCPSGGNTDDNQRRA